MRITTINKRIKDGTPAIHLKLTEKDLPIILKDGINFGLSTDKKLIIFHGEAIPKNLLFCFASREQSMEFLRKLIDYNKYELVIECGKEIKKDVKIPIETKLELQKLRVLL